ncbi:MAG: hypothetical protein E7541_04635 [Ruminococcaceae bacterium]|nr:hypothetical protein [Oscillospiraceae bacterium]
MKRRMYMFDFARLRTYCKDELAALMALLERLGYNELGLYVEGAFLPDGQQGAVRHGVITQQNADEILALAEAHHMTVLPMTNVLFHMEHFLCQERYAHLRRNGHQRARNLLNFEHEEAVPFALGIIRALADMFHTKRVQIGLDEFPFTPEEIPTIGRYIAAVTAAMLKEGLTPGVWSDMFWMEPALLPYLPRETEIYDWNYYGHRPESIRYFRDNGFEQVIAVPSDNGWEGFVGFQRASAYLRARGDLAVAPGEIEAFLEDAKNEGADGGMIANWENTTGRSLWSALVPLARAGLWMQGRWEYGKPEEEQVEQALFGRMTPYTRIVAQLRDLQVHNLEKGELSLPQDALYQLPSMLKLLNRPMGFWDDTIALYNEALPQMRADLEAWVPISAQEKYAHAALCSVVTNVRVASLLMSVSRARTIYHEAALKQFHDPAAFLVLLEEFCGCIRQAVAGLKDSIAARTASTCNTGITQQDIAWQNDLIAHLEKILSRLAVYQQDPTTAPALRSYTETIYCWDFTPSGYTPQ